MTLVQWIEIATTVDTEKIDTSVLKLSTEITMTTVDQLITTVNLKKTTVTTIQEELHVTITTLKRAYAMTINLLPK